MASKQEPSGSPIKHASLKAKQRRLREGFPEPVSLRVHRAISWLGRAEQEAEDGDVRFILLWVSFNSAYASDLAANVSTQRDSFRAYFNALISLDRSNRVYDAVWARFPHEIRILLSNKYVFAPFWDFTNGLVANDDWERRLDRSQHSANAAIRSRDTPTLLSIVFDRLYVLRNQLIHGGATWNSSVNRSQVRDGAAVLGWLLPLFIDIMMDNAERDWGRPYYPVVQ